MSEVKVNAAVCEICGGKLILKDENSFECEMENIEKALTFVSEQNKTAVQNMWDNYQSLCEEGAGKIKSEQERLAPEYARLNQAIDVFFHTKIY